METRFCPYCGTENKAASKHISDMEKYSEDYKATKEEVLSNSRRFNTKTFKITVVAVTIAAIALLILLCLSVDTLSRTRSRAVRKAKTDSYYSEIMDLMAKDDYFALDELIKSENIYFYYGTKLYDYNDVKYVTDRFGSLYTYIMIAIQPKDSVYSSMAANINDCINGILLREVDSKDPAVYKYVEDIQRDTRLLLKAYLNMTDEDIENYMELSGAGRALLIEEVYNNVTSK